MTMKSGFGVVQGHFFSTDLAFQMLQSSLSKRNNTQTVDADAIESFAEAKTRKRALR